MTRVILKDWDRAGRYWALDTESGGALSAGAGVCHGFLCTFPGHDGTATVPRVAAVYADGGKLWIQVDSRRWEVEDVELDHQFDVSGVSRFAISAHGESVVDIVYLGPGADPLNRLDPSFDALDVELQDIFYFVARNSRNAAWSAGVLALWSDGIA